MEPLEIKAHDGAGEFVGIDLKPRAIRLGRNIAKYELGELFGTFSISSEDLPKNIPPIRGVGEITVERLAFVSRGGSNLYRTEEKLIDCECEFDLSFECETEEERKAKMHSGLMKAIKEQNPRFWQSCKDGGTRTISYRILLRNFDCEYGQFIYPAEVNIKLKDGRVV